MEKEDFYAMMRSNPVMPVATMDGDQPRVRAMLLYKADSSGILFHMGRMKDAYRQIGVSPKAELCFNDYTKSIQVRVCGILEEITTVELQDEIYQHPSRAFMKPWRENGQLAQFYEMVRVFKLTQCKGYWWSMATNFEKKVWVDL